MAEPSITNCTVEEKTRKSPGKKGGAGPTHAKVSYGDPPVYVDLYNIEPDFMMMLDTALAGGNKVDITYDEKTSTPSIVTVHQK